jgi:hypothetical protein
MAHVPISADGGGPTVTGNDGRFTFNFSNKNRGDTALLVPQKDGYLVVNDVQMEVVLPAERDSREILVRRTCQKGGNKRKMTVRQRKTTLKH